MSFGVTLGLLGGAAPVVLRERGVALAEIGLLQTIYLPLGLTFLWSPLIDKLRLPPFAHRIGWIVAMQILGLALLVLLHQGETWPVSTLFLLAIGTSFAFATMDVTVEALVVETISAEQRPLATTVKLCGASIGGILGSGLLTILYHRLGWEGSFVVIIAVDAACLLPIFAYPEPPMSRLKTKQGWLYRSGRFRALAGRALIIGWYFAASSLFLGPASLLLVDLHVPLVDVGFATGTIGPAINLGATIASGALMSRFAASRIVGAMSILVAISGALLVLATMSQSPRLGVVAAVLGIAAASFLGVPVFNMIYRWAQGPTAATDYSLLFGLGFLAAMPARLGGPALAAVSGWSAFYALTTLIYVASLWFLGSAMRRTEHTDSSASI